jgi:Zn-dependent protease
MTEKRKRPTNTSLGVGRILGVQIRLHWSFIGLVALVALMSASKRAGSIASGLAWIGVIFGSVLVHEVAHCIVARRLGAVVDDILLTPLGGLSRLREMPEAPNDELAVAIVGPLTSFGLAAAAAVLGVTLGVHLWPPTLFAGSWLARLAWLNVLLAGFNLLPALPMDGGRVLRAMLARHHDRRAATRMAAQIARYLALLMIIAGFTIDFWLIFIGVFVYMGAGAEERTSSSGAEHMDDRPSIEEPPTQKTSSGP